MNNQWNSRRHSTLESVSALAGLLADVDAEPRSLVVAYLDSKRQLARAFQGLSEDLWYDPVPLAAVKLQIEVAANALFPDIPIRYRMVRGYGRVHEMLFAYFCARVGREITADELRVLTGDAVHTERRARDLRDLGLILDAFENGGLTVYVLRDVVPKSGVGAASIVAKNVKNDKKLTSLARNDLLARVHGPDIFESQ